MEAGALISELKRRRVFRVLVGYGIVSFAVLQVVEPVMHALHLPDVTLTYVVLALAVGFPVAVVLAWAFDINEGKVERTSPVAPHALKGIRLPLVLVGIGLIAAAPGVVWYFILPGHLKGSQEAVTGTAPTTAPPSIAVLPFADMSPGKDQEYFSDGIAEELLNALARVKGLKVAGRTSSFSFKGKSQDLRTIGETLGVANVLEGAVRKQGSKVRITAQLIQVRDGFHLWSKTFDGELTDVFELQEKIARATTDELKVLLQGEQETRLVPVATKSQEAFGLYLEATAVFNRRDSSRMGQAIGWLGRALELDPGFARAHARLAMLHTHSDDHVYGSGRGVGLHDEGERHARRALELEPGLAEPHFALSGLYNHLHRFADARASIERALELEPDNASAHFAYAQTLVWTGYTRRAGGELDRTLALDPILPNALNWRGWQSSFGGDQDAAERALVKAMSLGLEGTPEEGMAEVAAARGDFARARSLAAPYLLTWDWTCLKDPAKAVPIVLEGVFGGDAPARARALGVIDECLEAAPEPRSAAPIVSLMRLGQPARALAVMPHRPFDNWVFVYLFSPFGRATRALPGFAGFARDVGLADLWERYGPPDGCHRVALREFVCN